jgi:hypothetical protein
MRSAVRARSCPEFVVVRLAAGITIGKRKKAAIATKAAARAMPRISGEPEMHDASPLVSWTRIGRRSLGSVEGASFRGS